MHRSKHQILISPLAALGPVRAASTLGRLVPGGPSTPWSLKNLRESGRTERPSPAPVPYRCPFLREGGRAAFDSQAIWASLGMQVLSKEEREFARQTPEDWEGLSVRFCIFSLPSLSPFGRCHVCKLPSWVLPWELGLFLHFAHTLRVGVMVFLRGVNVGQGSACSQEYTTCLYFNVLCLFAVFNVFVPGEKAREKQNSKTPS